MRKVRLFFDYDGTLQETMKLYKPAVLEEVDHLRSLGYAVNTPSDERMESWLGINIIEMWKDFCPEASEEVRREGAKRIALGMRAVLTEIHDAWYDGVREMLSELKDAGCRLDVLSNCEQDYAALHASNYEMSRWFDHFYDCESYGWIPKGEILAKILAEGGADPSENSAETSGNEAPVCAIMIGDRGKDLDAAKLAGIPFIACRYGYGTEEELRGADAEVFDPTEIPAAVKRILAEQQ